MKQKTKQNSKDGGIAHTEASENLTGEKIVPSLLGKFKDVESLLKAYDALQAEFTKRCQRVKALEGEVDRLILSTSEKSGNGEPASEEVKSTEEFSSAIPVNADEINIDEVLSQDSPERDDGFFEEENFNTILNFFKNYPSAVKFSEDLLKGLRGKVKEEDLLKSFVKSLLSNNEKIRTEEISYDKITPSLKERIIKEYLVSLKDSVTKPTTLLSGEGVIPLSPPVRPKNIAEAGALAKKIIKIK